MLVLLVEIHKDEPIVHVVVSLLSASYLRVDGVHVASFPRKRIPIVQFHEPWKIALRCLHTTC